MKLSLKSPLAMPPILVPTDPGYALEAYTPRQAALYLRISSASVYAEVAAGKLSHRRNGERGEILMSQADLDDWREAHRVPAKRTATPTRQPHGDPRAPLRMPQKRMFG
jgi:excisionase family DNA binding protein